MRTIICVMTYRTCACWYAWVTKTCWFFICVIFILLPYICMLAFPQLLLLWRAFFMLTICLPALFAPTKFIRILDKTLKNSDIVRVWSFMTMLLWLLFLSVHRKFTQWWLMVFSLFGWLSLLKGVFLLRFPEWGHTKYKRFYSGLMWSIFIGIFTLIFSLFLIRLAYFIK